MPAAGGTRLILPPGIAAVVAHQVTVGLVVGQGDAAIGAPHRFSAVHAQGKAGKSPAVDEQNGLLPPLPGLEKLLRQLVAEGGEVEGFLLLAHIHDPDGRKGRRAVPLRQGEQRVLSGLGGVVAFDAGRRRGQQQRCLVADAPQLGDIPGVVSRGGI